MVSVSESPQKGWQLTAPTWQWLRCARIWATTAQTGPLLCDLEVEEVIVYACEEKQQEKLRCVFVV